MAAALAIAIGGGLGHWVGTRDAESESIARPAQASKPTVKPIVEVEAPTPAAVSNVPAQPDHEIEIEPESVAPGASPVVRHPKPKPKQTPKPSKRTPCNVYDHMDGC